MTKLRGRQTGYSSHPIGHAETAGSGQSRQLWEESRPHLADGRGGANKPLRRLPRETTSRIPGKTARAPPRLQARPPHSAAHPLHWSDGTVTTGLPARLRHAPLTGEGTRLSARAASAAQVEEVTKHPRRLVSGVAPTPAGTRPLRWQRGRYTPQPSVRSARARGPGHLRQARGAAPSSVRER